MENIYIKDLVSAVKGKFVFGDPYRVVTSVSTDTRKLQAGDVFFALKGPNFDGHDYLPKAIGLGASAIVISRIEKSLDKSGIDLPAIVLVKDTLEALDDFAGYYRRQFEPAVIAITGSNGKTTTREMLYSILNLAGPVITNKENFNNLIGLPLTLFSLKREHKYCVLELGVSLKGEINRLLAVCNPDIGIITNIGRSHLEFLNSQEEVFVEKSKLFKSLGTNGTAIINMTDKYLSSLKNSLSCRIVTYGMDESCDVYAADINSETAGITFKLHIRQDSLDVNLPVQGRFNVLNSLAAAAAAFSLNVDLLKIKQGIESFNPPKMRMEHIRLNNGAILINDAYNANPDSMQQSLLNFVAAYPGREKIAVLGDMLELGEHSEKEHKILGEILNKLELHEIYLYGDAIRYAMQPENPAIKHFADKDAVIAKLKSKLNKSSVVLFKASRRVGLEKIIEGLMKY